MGDDGNHSSQGLKNLKKEWSLFWGRFVENEDSQQEAESSGFKNKISEAVDVARLDLNKLQDISQSMNLHKKLLDVEMDSIQKEIEQLALKLSQENRKGAKAVFIRNRLKELFAIEENLNIQMDSLQSRLSQANELEKGIIKGVS